MTKNLGDRWSALSAVNHVHEYLNLTLLILGWYVYTRRVVTKLPLVIVTARAFPLCAQPACRTVFSQLLRVSTMTTDPKQSKGRDGALSVLGIAIEGLNLAKEISSITPAKAVFGSASVILAMIKVRCFLLFYGNKLQLHVCPGLYGQRAGLHRSRVVLRRSVRCPRPGIEREAAGRTRSACARGD